MTPAAAGTEAGRKVSASVESGQIIFGAELYRVQTGQNWLGHERWHWRCREEGLPNFGVCISVAAQPASYLTLAEIAKFVGLCSCVVSYFTVILPFLI